METAYFHIDYSPQRCCDVVLLVEAYGCVYEATRFCPRGIVSPTMKIKKKMSRSVLLMLSLLVSSSSYNARTVAGSKIPPHHVSAPREQHRTTSRPSRRAEATPSRTRQRFSFVLSLGISCLAATMQSHGKHGSGSTALRKASSSKRKTVVGAWHRPPTTRRSKVVALRAEEEAWLEALKEMSGNSGLPTGPRKVIRCVELVYHWHVLQQRKLIVS